MSVHPLDLVQVIHVYLWCMRTGGSYHWHPIRHVYGLAIEQKVHSSLIILFDEVIARQTQHSTECR